MDQKAMKVLILSPRLDTTFKRGLVPVDRGPIEPIREHWANFIYMLEEEYLNRGHTVKRIDAPLWQFTPNLVEHMNADITFVPHKTIHNFDCKGMNVYYYMQMVIPHLFSVDLGGWGADTTFFPLQPAPLTNHYAYMELKKRIDENVSKFTQPNPGKFFNNNFLFFPCQIPHDETIKYHSSVSVADALRRTIAFAQEIGRTLIVKGHPVNPGSMYELENIAKAAPNVEWVTDVSIHDLLSKCEAVFTVNSGVGLEAILHGKPVFTFGHADYESVSIHIGNDKVWPHHWVNRDINLYSYPFFIEAYMQAHYDTTDEQSFSKLPEA